ncbi:MAG: hypothetical protein VKJ06_05190 [Vampirovibrionales bacterium]|nr:hypothetical protein [Vampirovibrionales bacterium]
MALLATAAVASFAFGSVAQYKQGAQVAEAQQTLDSSSVLLSHRPCRRQQNNFYYPPRVGYWQPGPGFPPPQYNGGWNNDGWNNGRWDNDWNNGWHNGHRGRVNQQNNYYYNNGGWYNRRPVISVRVG